jgi:hypothetical protein
VIHFFEFLLFHFWCLDAKGREEYIFLIVVYRFIWSLALYYVESVVWTWILKLLWCACKNLIILLWLV